MGKIGENKTDEGTISLQVSAQIVKHISSGLYRSPGSALKELISNSFDASAKKVEITYDFEYDSKGYPEIKKLTIEDDGEGMDIDDLKKIFTHVGGSSKDDPHKEPVTNKFNRPVIGSFGIGMLSVAATCTSFTITTKKMGQAREFSANVSFTFFKDAILRNESMDKVKLGNIDLSSRSVPDNEFKQYTKYEISNFEPPFMEGLDPTLKDSFLFTKVRDNESEDAYFKKFVLHIQNLKDKSTKKLAYLDKMITDVGVMAPVEYLSDGPIRKIINFEGKEYKVPGTDHPDYLELIERPKKFEFEVKVKLKIGGEVRNEFKIFKPFLYPCERDLKTYGFNSLNPKVIILPKIDNDIRVEDQSTSHVKISGYYYHQEHRIIPLEFSGFLFRVRNVSLGYNLGDPLSLFADTYLILHQTFSEIYLDNGFQRIVNLDRESLFEGSYVFRFLEEYLRNIIKPQDMPENKVEKVPTEKLFKETSKAAINNAIKTYKVENIVGGIRADTANRRRSRIKSTSETVQKEIINNGQAGSIKIERTNKVTEMQIRTESDTTVAIVPRFRKRNELWDNLAIGTLKLIHDDKTREDMIKFIMELYSKIERDELN